MGGGEAQSGLRRRQCPTKTVAGPSILFQDCGTSWRVRVGAGHGRGAFEDEDQENIKQWLQRFAGRGSRVAREGRDDPNVMICWSVDFVWMSEPATTDPDRREKAGRLVTSKSKRGGGGGGGRAMSSSRAHAKASRGTNEGGAGRGSE